MPVNSIIIQQLCVCVTNTFSIIFIMLYRDYNDNSSGNTNGLSDNESELLNDYTVCRHYVIKTILLVTSHLPGGVTTNYVLWMLPLNWRVMLITGHTLYYLGTVYLITSISMLISYVLIVSKHLTLFCHYWYGAVFLLLLFVIYL